MTISCFDLFNDGIFAAIAAIGFASISNPSSRSYFSCALLAAVGHIVRFILLHYGLHLTLASFAAGLSIGTLAIPLSAWKRCPAEGLSFPALLPMIPGKYAYGSIQALLECLGNSQEQEFQHYFYLLQHNWLTCTLTILMMVVGVTIPLFTFRNHGLNVLLRMRRKVHSSSSLLL
ncbi:MAG: threonine/serine exporter family protein [Bacteroidales bacterium]|nr:threonine/serine exporter family protein [Bacteroidales bacterium]